MKKGLITALVSIIVLLSFALSVLFDDVMAVAIASLQNSFLNQAMMITSYLGIALVICIMATCTFLMHNRKRIFSVWISFAITALIVVLLRLIIPRARPFEALGLNTLDFMTSNYALWNLSFPSLHAALAFAALPFFEGKIKYCWLAFAALVAFSRAFFALHYISDIIAGAAMGFVVSSILIKIFKLRKGIIK